MALDPKLMLLHAEEFRRSAITLEGPNGAHSEHVIIPMSMCYAFATEIYLKFLIYTQTGHEPPHKHHLRKLFDLLPKKVADQIRFKWEHPKPGIAATRAAISNAMEAPHPNFDETLDKSSDAFTRLRYAYQHDRDALNWLGGDICECARKVIFDIYPTEYQECRLPLPAGSINQDQANVVRGRIMQHPLRQPPKPS